MLSTRLGRWDDAERQFRAALVRDPLNTYVMLQPRHALTTAQVDSPNPKAVFGSCLRLQPDFAWTRNYLGKTLLAAGQTESGTCHGAARSRRGGTAAYPPDRACRQRPQGRGGRGAAERKLRNGRTPARIYVAR